jgi:repressor LexA
MRCKSPELKNKIYDFINDWKRDNGWSPSMTDIASGVGISRNTAYRYIIEMTEDGSGLTYDGKVIGTREMCAENTTFSKAMLVGSIPCGEPASEEQFVDAYVNLPANLFGKGDFYILRAKGDSMEDAGIEEGDMVVIRIQPIANIGDIVVALDEDQQNTLKRYGGKDKHGRFILEYMNEAVYPDKVILVKEFTVQGVAEYVIKKLQPGGGGSSWLKRL